MSLKLAIDTGSYKGELRVIYDAGKWVVRAAVVLPWHVLSPFYTVKEFEVERDAMDYATTLKAAFLGVSPLEVEG